MASLWSWRMTVQRSFTQEITVDWAPLVTMATFTAEGSSCGFFSLEWNNNVALEFNRGANAAWMHVHTHVHIQPHVLKKQVGTSQHVLQRPTLLNTSEPFWSCFSPPHLMLAAGLVILPTFTFIPLFQTPGLAVAFGIEPENRPFRLASLVQPQLLRSTFEFLSCG